jgi:hypothetical protein
MERAQNRLSMLLELTAALADALTPIGKSPASQAAGR